MVDGPGPRGGGSPRVAAAVVVCAGRVLLLRRAVPEGGLVWQFPAGKVEVGESDVEAAVREAWEEVGLRVELVGWLGERLHPVTRRSIAYVACRVAGGSARAAAPDEVAEVVWCGREDLARLVPPSQLFGPVRGYLDGVLDRTAGSSPD